MLHYLLTRDGVYLSSEKKALLPFMDGGHPGNDGVDRASPSHYLTLQYVSKDYQCSRITVRRAVDELCHLGLLHPGLRTAPS